jgi:hypothetical protein
MPKDNEHNVHPDRCRKVQVVTDLLGELLIPNRYDDLKGVPNLSYPWTADEDVITLIVE